MKKLLLSFTILLNVCPIGDCQRANFQSLLKQAKAKGLKGYDLIDALDMWFGSNSPDYNGPFQQLDRLGNNDGKVTAQDWKAAGLPSDHFTYFDKNGDAKMDVHETHSWHQQRKPARYMNLSDVDDPPKGHLKPLGSHKDPLSNDGLIYHKPFPHPREFWKKHMDGYKPALLKGAQAGWPCMGWTRDVLAKRFGWIDAKLEPKVESRGNNSGYKDLDAAAPRNRLNVSEYLRVEEGKNMYVVSIVPQEMAWEVAHPSTFLCGSRKKMVDRRSKPPYKLREHEYPHEAGFDWMTHIFEANLWMASGYTRSSFHYDKEWNVNCLLSGTKRWVFMNPFWYDKELQWSRGNMFRSRNPLNNQWTDWVYLDPDNVDLIVQNKLRNMDYYEMVQEAGDCLFIPYSMLHQVQKIHEDLQVAVSWMFLPESIYDEEVCKDAPLEEDLPLAAMDTLFMYSGKGLIPQGYGDPLEFVQRVEEMMQQQTLQHLSLKEFGRLVQQGTAILRGKKDRIRMVYKQISAYAKDPSKGLTIRELRSVPLRIWAKPAAEGDREGPLPCDKGEEYYPCLDDEFAKMTEFVKTKVPAPKDGAKSPVDKRDPKFRRVYSSVPPSRQQAKKEEL